MFYKVIHSANHKFNIHMVEIFSKTNILKYSKSRSNLRKRRINHNDDGENDIHSSGEKYTLYMIWVIKFDCVQLSRWLEDIYFFWFERFFKKICFCLQSIYKYFILKIIIAFIIATISFSMFINHLSLFWIDKKNPFTKFISIKIR